MEERETGLQVSIAAGCEQWTGSDVCHILVPIHVIWDQVYPTLKLWIVESKRQMRKNHKTNDEHTFFGASYFHIVTLTCIFVCSWKMATFPPSLWALNTARRRRSNKLLSSMSFIKLSSGVPHFVSILAFFVNARRDLKIESGENGIFCWHSALIHR